MSVLWALSERIQAHQHHDDGPRGGEYEAGLSIRIECRTRGLLRLTGRSQARGRKIAWSPVNLVGLVSDSAPRAQGAGG